MSDKTYIDLDTEEGQEAWKSALPVERFLEEGTGRYFIQKFTPRRAEELIKWLRENPQKNPRKEIPIEKTEP